MKTAPVAAAPELQQSTGELAGAINHDTPAEHLLVDDSREHHAASAEEEHEEYDAEPPPTAS